MSQIEETNLMPTAEHPQAAAAETSPRPVSRLSQNPPQHHTHVQHSCGCVHVDIVGLAGC